MDLTLLKQLSEYSFSLKEATPPILMYANQSLLTEMDEKVLEQISNVAKLPGLVGPAMTMPDAHWGYGFPIGGVAAFDAHKGGIISAGGVGFDISCGVRCLRTPFTLAEILPHIEEIADALFAAVPAGVGREGKLRVTMRELDRIMLQGAKWAVQSGFGVEADLLYTEEEGVMQDAQPEFVSLHAKRRQLGEMGTLGSGNHYLEVEVVERIDDEEAATAFGIMKGQIIIAIHCGSRGLGHQIGSDYLVLLAKEAKRFNIQLPDRELACAPIFSEEGSRYIGAMHAGINCALANRQIITHLTREAIESVMGKTTIDTLYDVSHNTCKREIHQVAGHDRELYIHRKGATRAYPPGHKALPAPYRAFGQPVFIGGSMGTGSYLLAGNPPTQNKAFASASHGSGRRISRSKALKRWDGRSLIKELAASGIYIRTSTLRGVAEEAPLAYKDVDVVAEVTEKAGLARRVAYLKPLACIKG